MPCTLGSAMATVARAAVVVAALIAASACDMSGIPQVAGTYRGTMTVTFGSASAQSEARMVVEQAAAQLTISLSMLSPQGFTGVLPAMSGTLDRTGAFHFEEIAGGASTPSVLTAGACGRFGPGAHLTLTFSGREAHFSMGVDTSRCGPLSIHAILTR